MVARAGEMVLEVGDPTLVGKGGIRYDAYCIRYRWLRL